MIAERNLTGYAWLSIAAALITIGLKVAATLFTDSVGLLSDALESGINLVAAILALVVLHVVAQPPDVEHAYGHSKAEYFSSGVEGSMILVAAVTIFISGWQRLFSPRPLTRLDLGLAMALLASLVNGSVAVVLLRAGKRERSITLEANARHLLTDVWTSAGVIAGVAGVRWLGWSWLDSAVAFLVAGNIVYAGIGLVRRAVSGLMDSALPAAEVARLEQVLKRYESRGIQYHALRTRQSGAQRFVSVHIQVPGAWDVQRGHSLLEEIERELRQALPPLAVITHLEPLEDPTSWQDMPLNRT